MTFVGLDLHKRYITLCALDGQGVVLGEQRRMPVCGTHCDPERQKGSRSSGHSPPPAEAARSVPSNPAPQLAGELLKVAPSGATLLESPAAER